MHTDAHTEDRIERREEKLTNLGNDFITKEDRSYKPRKKNKTRGSGGIVHFRIRKAIARRSWGRKRRRKKGRKEGQDRGTEGQRDREGKEEEGREGDREGRRKEGEMRARRDQPVHTCEGHKMINCRSARKCSHMQ